MEITIKVSVRDTNPSISGWYDTNKDKLYWFATMEAWSCREDRVSEEYPTWWLKQLTSDSDSLPEVTLKNCKNLGDTYIDWNKITPEVQWQRIDFMLHEAGLKVVKQLTISDISKSVCIKGFETKSHYCFECEKENNCDVTC